MQKIPKKQLYNGSQIPSIGMGTFGSDLYTPSQVASAVSDALQIGFRLFDCASIYNNEQEVGEIFYSYLKSGKLLREELFVMSKVWNNMHDRVADSCHKSLSDLQLDYLDAYFVHWPFPNYHPPHCNANSRDLNAKPFSVDVFMNTWQQMEYLVYKGWVRHIGMSNMTIPKLESVLPLCKIKPSLIEMELHPSFQQPQLFNYCISRNILPVGFCPIGSPHRPERDRTPEDINDLEIMEVIEIAKAHKIHPAVVCLKWAIQRGQIPIPFSVFKEELSADLLSILEDPLSRKEMDQLRKVDKNCRLIKGQVFLWPGADSWTDIWDVDGYIAK